jgi:transposase, IS30 family
VSSSDRRNAWSTWVAIAHGRPGPAPQSAKREQFARLIARGVPNAEACRIVGINRRTGKRWRHGRTITSSNGRRLHYPPVINSRQREISARYLSEDERVRIADLRRAGHGVRAIAITVARSAATVSREAAPEHRPDQRSDRPFTAQRLATERRARPGRGKLAHDPVLRRFVQDRLAERWSPEQIRRTGRSARRGLTGPSSAEETGKSAVVIVMVVCLALCRGSGRHRRCHTSA